MPWHHITKRYAIACFLSQKPGDPDSEGDVEPQTFDDLEEARAWVRRAAEAGRFKYFCIWDGQSGSEWVFIEDFPEDEGKSN